MKKKTATGAYDVWIPSPFGTGIWKIDLWSFKSEEPMASYAQPDNSPKASFVEQPQVSFQDQWQANFWWWAVAPAPGARPFTVQEDVVKKDTYDYVERVTWKAPTPQEQESIMKTIWDRWLWMDASMSNEIKDAVDDTVFWERQSIPKKVKSWVDSLPADITSANPYSNTINMIDRWYKYFRDDMVKPLVPLLASTDFGKWFTQAEIFTSQAAKSLQDNWLDKKFSYGEGIDPENVSLEAGDDWKSQFSYFGGSLLWYAIDAMGIWAASRWLWIASKIDSLGTVIWKSIPIIGKLPIGDKLAVYLAAWLNAGFENVVQWQLNWFTEDHAKQAAYDFAIWWIMWPFGELSDVFGKAVAGSRNTLRKAMSPAFMFWLTYSTTRLFGADNDEALRQATAMSVMHSIAQWSKPTYDFVKNEIYGKAPTDIYRHEMAKYQTYFDNVVNHAGMFNELVNNPQVRAKAKEFGDIFKWWKMYGGLPGAAQADQLFKVIQKIPGLMETLSVNWKDIVTKNKWEQLKKAMEAHIDLNIDKWSPEYDEAMGDVNRAMEMLRMENDLKWMDDNTIAAKYEELWNATPFSETDTQLNSIQKNIMENEIMNRYPKWKEELADTIDLVKEDLVKTASSELEGNVLTMKPEWKNNKFTESQVKSTQQFVESVKWSDDAPSTLKKFIEHVEQEKWYVSPYDLNNYQTYLDGGNVKSPTVKNFFEQTSLRELQKADPIINVVSKANPDFARSLIDKQISSIEETKTIKKTADKIVAMVKWEIETLTDKNIQSPRKDKIVMADKATAEKLSKVAERSGADIFEKAYKYAKEKWMIDKAAEAAMDDLVLKAVSRANRSNKMVNQVGKWLTRMQKNMLQDMIWRTDVFKKNDKQKINVSELDAAVRNTESRLHVIDTIKSPRDIFYPFASTVKKWVAESLQKPHIVKAIESGKKTFIEPNAGAGESLMQLDEYFAAWLETAKLNITDKWAFTILSNLEKIEDIPGLVNWLNPMERDPVSIEAAIQNKLFEMEQRYGTEKIDRIRKQMIDGLTEYKSILQKHEGKVELSNEAVSDFAQGADADNAIISIDKTTLDSLKTNPFGDSNSILYTWPVKWQDLTKLHDMFEISPNTMATVENGTPIMVARSNDIEISPNELWQMYAFRKSGTVVDDWLAGTQAEKIDKVVAKFLSAASEEQMQAMDGLVKLKEKWEQAEILYDDMVKKVETLVTWQDKLDLLRDMKKQVSGKKLTWEYAVKILDIVQRNIAERQWLIDKIMDVYWRIKSSPKVDAETKASLEKITKRPNTKANKLAEIVSQDYETLSPEDKKFFIDNMDNDKLWDAIADQPIALQSMDVDRLRETLENVKWVLDEWKDQVKYRDYWKTQEVDKILREVIDEKKSLKTQGKSDKIMSAQNKPTWNALMDWLTLQAKKFKDWAIKTFTLPDNLAEMTGMNRIKQWIDEAYGDYMQESHNINEKELSIIKKHDLRETDMNKVWLFWLTKRGDGRGIRAIYDYLMDVWDPLLPKSQQVPYRSKLQFADQTKVMDGKIVKDIVYKNMSEVNAEIQAKIDSYSAEDFLNPAQKEYYDFWRKTFDDLHPKVAATYLDQANQVLQTVQNYWPLMRDKWVFDEKTISDLSDESLSIDQATLGRIIKWTIEHGFTKTVKWGRNITLLNARAVGNRYKDTWLYYAIMQPQVATAGRVIRELNKHGELWDLWGKMWNKYMQTIVTKGATVQNLPGWEKSFEKALSRYQKSLIALNPTSWAIQTSALFDAGVTGVNPLPELMEIMTNKASREKVFNLSADLRFREGNDPIFIHDSDVQKWFDNTMESFTNIATKPMRYIDSLVWSSIFLNQYRKNIAAWFSERDATYRANKKTREVIWSPAYKDMSQFVLNNRWFKKIFSMFQTFVVNRMNTWIKYGISNPMRTMVFGSLAITAEAMIRSGMTYMMESLYGDDKKAEEAVSSANVIKQLSNSITWLIPGSSIINNSNYWFPLFRELKDVTGIIADIPDYIAWDKNTYGKLSKQLGTTMMKLLWVPGVAVVGRIPVQNQSEKNNSRSRERTRSRERKPRER